MAPAWIPLHAFHQTPPELPVRILLNAVAGLAATAVMNVPMNALPEGSTPPFVTASAMSGEPPDETESGLANAVHYASGTLAGVLFTLLAVGFEIVLPSGQSAARVPLTPLPLIPHMLAALGTFGVLLTGFAYVVLPRFGAGESNDRVRHDWTISAAVYTVALAVLVPVVTVTAV